MYSAHAATLGKGLPEAAEQVTILTDGKTVYGMRADDLVEYCQLGELTSAVDRFFRSGAIGGQTVVRVH